MRKHVVVFVLGAASAALVMLAFFGRYQVTESHTAGPFGFRESVVRRFDRWTGEVCEYKSGVRLGNQPAPVWSRIEEPTKASADPYAGIGEVVGAARARPALDLRPVGASPPASRGVTFLDEEPEQ